MGCPPIRTFSYHCREKYGRQVGKISVDMGQVCPNRLRGGCIFCRPESFTPSFLNNSDAISRQIEQGKKHLLRGRFKSYFAYFQQETCTAVDPDHLLPALRQVLTDEACVGTILSTRPDFLEQSLVDDLAGLVVETGKDCLVELGLQTVHERSLTLLNRNHDFGCFQHAVQRLKGSGRIDVGVHLIFGVPGESEEDMLFSLQTVCALGVDAVKLHHLQVIRGTELEKQYDRGEVPIFTKEQYMELLLSMLPHIPCRVTIHRLWATAHPDILVAPRWNILAGKLSGELLKSMAKRKIWQGSACSLM